MKNLVNKIKYWVLVLVFILSTAFFKGTCEGFLKSYYNGLAIYYFMIAFGFLVAFIFYRILFWKRAYEQNIFYGTPSFNLHASRKNYVEEGKERDGVKVGRYKIYNQQKILVEEGKYLSGKKIGSYRKYYENGALKEISVYQATDIGDSIFFSYLLSCMVFLILFFNKPIFYYLLNVNKIVFTIGMILGLAFSFLLTNLLVEYMRKLMFNGAYSGNYIEIKYYESGGIKSKITYKNGLEIEILNYNELGERLVD